MGDRKRFKAMMKYYRDRVMKAKPESLGLAVDDMVSFFCEEINKIILQLNAYVLKSKVNK